MSVAGWVYGASYSPPDRFAFPTGVPGDVVKGRLACWSSDAFPSQLRTIDKWAQYHTQQPQQGLVRRGLVNVVQHDGSLQLAYWYYQIASENHDRKKQQKQALKSVKKTAAQEQANNKNKTKKIKQTLPLPNCSYEYWDTHCHLDMILTKINKSSPLSWQSFRENSLMGKVGGVVSVSCETDTVDPLLKLLDHDTTGLVYGAFGMHPHEAKFWTSEVEENLIKAMKHPKVVAWGECGLDYHYNYSDLTSQRRVFARQIQLAVASKKPLMVHSREAEQDTIDILTEHAPSDYPIHLHCFTSSQSMAKSLLQRFSNLYFGFTGVITFPSSEDIQETVKMVPLSRILTETDGPYMSPNPYRGDVAHPGHIPVIAEKIAQLKGVSLEACLSQVRVNIKDIYGV
eukprot:gb/GEZN01009885.1/.p1 GENE.gb/GEZN01009885.1/~~gb/GEZN01009885.1/.p1  ORF type:complete len:426 (+),score=33.57 gb/GEZN01009885.1/:84-1280(+)